MILMLVCWLSQPAHAQWITDPDYEAHAQRGIAEVYNLEFQKAESEFQYLIQKYPHHPSGKFFLAMVDWGRITLDIDNESMDERFIQKLNDVIDMCDDMLDRDENDVAALFFKGGALGFRGRLYAHRGAWMKAANDGRLALPIVQRAYKIAPTNYDILLGIGIYNYYAEVIPEQYPVVKPVMVFFPPGDRKRGIRQLVQAGLHAKYASAEANYFLLQLYYTYEKQYDKGIEMGKMLLERYPKNVLVHRYLGRCYVSRAQWPETRAVFSEILSRCNNGYTGYSPNTKREALYYLGVSQMNLNQLDDALRAFYQCDELCRQIDVKKESGYMPLTNLKIGMIYDLQSKRALALEQYRKVLQMDDYDNSRDLAERYSHSPFVR
ncbi:MAG: tetratricopeptide repeat protein [Acidobacteriota bacterium]